MEHTSRSKRNATRVEEFLEDSSRETLHLALFNNEISRLKKEFPEIEIEKGATHVDHRVSCVITRKK